MAIEHIILGTSILLLLGIIAGKTSDKLGVPALLLFLLIGMLAGSEGLGGVNFNDPWLAKSIGIIALIFIIFSGGLETNWKNISPVIKEGAILSTAGVLLTAIIVASFATIVFGFSLLEALLLGSIVSSTDAAAVFTVLRSRHVSLKARVKSLLELESGSNDPMAVFLTLSFIRLLTDKNTPFFSIIPSFFLEMGIGAAAGFVMGKLILTVINRIKLEYEALYPILTISLILLTYSLTDIFKGNGFLSVYIAGLILGNKEFMNKRNLVRFHAVLAWLMQIAMFLALGLLVLPSQLIPVSGKALLISAVLLFIARPASVFFCLASSKMTIQEKTMVTWAGLRGAAPIILATFPLLAGIQGAYLIFYVVFFIVLTSALLQGTTIPIVSSFLGVKVPVKAKPHYPLEFERVEGTDTDLTDVIIPYNSTIVGKRIYELGVPSEALIVMISREDKFIIPNGSIALEGGDILLVLAKDHDLRKLQDTIEGKNV
ncbi:MAG: potassium/proton antiporter [Candidatus Omnitrophica bacterium]|nr:potassium/proton antiporter [Candidatus Omnitrophota bacterium]